MAKADETLQESIITLRKWLQFIDARTADIKAQIERARRSNKNATDDDERRADNISSDSGFQDDESLPGDAGKEEEKIEKWL